MIDRITMGHRILAGNREANSDARLENWSLNMRGELSVSIDHVQFLNGPEREAYYLWVKGLLPTSD